MMYPSNTGPPFPITPVLPVPFRNSHPLRNNRRRMLAPQGFAGRYHGSGQFFHSDVVAQQPRSRPRNKENRKRKSEKEDRKGKSTPKTITTWIPKKKQQNEQTDQVVSSSAEPNQSRLSAPA